MRNLLVALIIVLASSTAGCGASQKTDAEARAIAKCELYDAAAIEAELAGSDSLEVKAAVVGADEYSCYLQAKAAGAVAGSGSAVSPAIAAKRAALRKPGAVGSN